jgi:Na+/H+-dicarboxylate symporter
MITDAIPPNIVAPFLSGNSLQLIVAALVIGLALNSSTKKVSGLKGLLTELDIVLGNVSSFIMKTVPFVVFCSTTRVFLLASLDVYIAIGHLILTMMVGLLIMIIVYCTFLIAKIRIKPIIFLQKYIPIMKDIFLKGSSLAAIPLTLRFCKRQLGIPQNVSSFVIPLGATINMDGTCVCLSIVSLFFARICGVTLGGSDIAILLFMVFVLSLGAPIAPGTIILCMATLFGQMGISLEGLSLLIGLNFILEMLLGMVNSMGDVVIALDVAKREGTLNYEICNKPVKKSKRK